MFRFVLVLLLVSGCSFDDKTGIWTGDTKISNKKLKNENLKTVFKKKENVSSNINLLSNRKIIFDEINSNYSWTQKYSNNNNYIGHIDFANNGNFIKLIKLSKNLINKNILYENKKLFFSDEKGNIGVYSTDINTKIFLFNFYKKKHKRIKKKINLIIKDELIFAADNLGYIYCLNYKSKKMIWAKNFLIPFRSNIKIIDKYIFIADEKNKIIVLNLNNGNKVDELYTKPAKTVSKFENNFVIDDNNNLLLLNTNGNLYSVNLVNNKIINWVRNFNSQDQSIFNAKPLIVFDNKILITTYEKISLFNQNGSRIWDLNINSDVVPVISGNSIFTINKDNYLVIIDKNDGKIIYSKQLNAILEKSLGNKYKKIKKINKLFLSNKKILLISDNSFFIELELNKNIKVLSVRKKPFDVYSDIVFVNNQLILVSKKNKLFQIF